MNAMESDDIDRYLENSQWGDALRLLIPAARSSYLVDNRAYAKIVTCIRKLTRQSGRTEKEYLKELANSTDKYLMEFKFHLQRSEHAKGLIAFNKGIDEMPISSAQRALFLECAEALVSGISGDYTKQEFPAVKRVQKVSVAGMGFSGSGAIYDFLRGFSSVVAIPSETRYISGPKSLLNIHEGNDITESLLDFFIFTLLGQGVQSDVNDYRAFIWARRKILRESNSRNLNYSVKLLSWCKMAADILYRARNSHSYSAELSLLTNFVVNEFSIDRCIGVGEVALLDNVVPIQNVRVANFIDDFKVFCSFRNPASTYFAKKNEKVFFDANPVKFSIVQLKAIEDNLKRISTLENDPSHRGLATSSIACMRFEDFIMEEGLRVKVADSLGLKEQNEALFFDAKKSMKNVVLHEPELEKCAFTHFRETTDIYEKLTQEIKFESSSASS